MNKISSKTTYIMKRAFPTFWFGFIAVSLMAGILGGDWKRQPVFLVIPLIMAGFGYFLFKGLVWDLMDEVYDCGDHLVIRNRGEEESVRLADVVNINSTTFVNPPRITLQLAVASKFGKNVSFSPSRALFFKPFSVSLIAENLIGRVDEARRARYQTPP